MRVTIKDIAEMAGVSHPTVSKALNNEPGVKKETKEKIIALARQYNYFKSNAVKKNCENRENVIGLSWPKCEGLFFYHLSREIQKMAEKKGIAILQSFSDLGDTLVLFGECSINKVAVWLAPDWIPDADFLNKREYFDGDLVVLGGGRLQHAHNITVDRKTGIFMAVKYLAELGHKKIAFFSEQKNDKLLGFSHGLLEFKLEYHPDYIITVDSEYALIKEGFLKLLDQRIRPTALVIDSQGVYFKVIKLLKEYKLQIPSDFSLIVYDDIPEMELFETPLTAIGPSISKLAEETINILLGSGNNTDEFLETEIIPELKVRESTRKLIY